MGRWAVFGFRAEEKSSKTDKKGRGLRHFAVRVCAIVKEKNATTYNEVGDELVEEEYSMSNVDVKLRSSREDDEKNIRRRVYDALNVLIAMDIIEKRKKEIFWRGLPSAEGDESVISKLKDEVSRTNAQGRILLGPFFLPRDTRKVTDWVHLRLSAGRWCPQ